MQQVKLSAANSRDYYSARGGYRGASYSSTERTGWVCAECYPAYQRENRPKVLRTVVIAIIRGILGSIAGGKP